MKLVYCRKCQDVVRLFDEPRQCKCGRVGGRYTDGRNAVYWGKEAALVGFDNPDFMGAVDYVSNGPSDDIRLKGSNFSAFVIWTPCSTFKRIRKPRGGKE